MTYRHYSDQERAQALATLAMNEGNITRTAAQLGIPESSLRSWRGNEDGAAPADVRAQEKKALHDECAALAWRFVERANDPAALQQTSAFYAVQAIEKLLNAMRALSIGDVTASGMPTEYKLVWPKPFSEGE